MCKLMYDNNINQKELSSCVHYEFTESEMAMKRGFQKIGLVLLCSV